MNQNVTTNQILQHNGRMVVLGSQSPRRLELLRHVVGRSALSVVPPLHSEELSFTDLTAVSDIEERLLEVVRNKRDDVAAQGDSQSAVILCADTIVVVTDPNNTCRVLGKPPQDCWQATVRDWFLKYYSQQTHEVWTGFEVFGPDGRQSRIVKTAVTMQEIDSRTIDWYLSTSEPVGKAGGYGIQGHAAMFVSRVDGSLTNVIGLPVSEVAVALEHAGVPVCTVDTTG